jgi:hypothetical protein
MESLRDPVTKKCCPVRCHKEASRISSTVTNLLIQITRLLSTRASETQTKTNTIMESCCKPLTEKVNALQDRISTIQRAIGDTIINRYAQANAKAQELMQSPATKTQEEYENESEPETEQTKTPSMVEQRESIQKRESESSQTQKPISQKSESQAPLTPQPKSQLETPPTAKKKTPECFEIDLCEPLYVFWQKCCEQQQAQLQLLANAMRINFPATPQDRKDREIDPPSIVALASIEYEQPPEEEI